MIKTHITGIGWVLGSIMGRGLLSYPLPNTSEVLPAIKGRDLFEEPNNRFGRLDKFSKVGFAGIAQAIKDSGLDKDESLRRAGVIALTRHGCTETDTSYFNTVIPDHGKLCSPNLFAYTLPSCFLGEVSIHYQLLGECYVLNGGEDAELHAVRNALLSIYDGTNDHMILGINDTWEPSFCSQCPGGLLGSIFVTISRSITTDVRSYGELVLNSDFSVRFRDRDIGSIIDLTTQFTND